MLVKLIQSIGANIKATSGGETSEVREIHSGATGRSDHPDSAEKPEAGRNDPCPCGAINPTSGEIYKHKKCGMISAPYHLGSRMPNR